MIVLTFKKIIPQSFHLSFVLVNATSFYNRFIDLSKNGYALRSYAANLQLRLSGNGLIINNIISKLINWIRYTYIYTSIKATT